MEPVPPPDPAMTDLTTKRGNPLFHHEGYLYTKDKVSKGDPSVIFWRCIKKNQCKGRICTRDGVFEALRCDHTHNPSAAETDARKVAHVVRSKALTTQETPSAIVNSVLSGVRNGSFVVIANAPAMKRSILRQRQSSNLKCLNLTSSSELQIP